MTSRDIPIIFSPPMVQAELDDLKTMTRRLAKRLIKTYPNGRDTPPTVLVERDAPLTKAKPGDRLWVREEWRVSKKWDSTKPANLPARTMSVMFKAGGSIANTASGWAPDRTWPLAGTFPEWAGRRRAARHMPRWASRLTLIVTATKIERLQEISEADAAAEGAPWYVYGHGVISDEEYRAEPGYQPNKRMGFCQIWNDLHGWGPPSAWEDNPLVVALSFSVIKANIDGPEARAA